MTRKEFARIVAGFDKYRDIFGIKATYGRTLVTKNTGLMFLMSELDWLKARGIKWFETENGRIINQKSVFFEDYVGIVGKRRKNATNRWDLSKYNYGRLK